MRLKISQGPDSSRTWKLPFYLDNRGDQLEDFTWGCAMITSVILESMAVWKDTRRWHKSGARIPAWKGKSGPWPLGAILELSSWTSVFSWSTWTTDHSRQGHADCDGSSRRTHLSILMSEDRQKARALSTLRKGPNVPFAWLVPMADAALPIIVLTLLHSSSFRDKIIHLRSVFPRK